MPSEEVTVRLTEREARWVQEAARLMMLGESGARWVTLQGIRQKVHDALREQEANDG